MRRGYIQWAVDCFSGDILYHGAPVRCEGRVMGSLCAMFSGEATDETRDKLLRAAGRLGDVLDAM